MNLNVNIIEAIEHPELFRPFLQDKDGSIKTWKPWLLVLRMLYGLPIPADDMGTVTNVTGRTVLKAAGFLIALFLTGRRSGKSRIAAVIGAYEALFAGHEKRLAKGERGVVIIASPTRSQSRIVKDYLRAIFDTEILRHEVVAETKEGFELASGIRIEILAGDWKSIRGFTVVAAIVDEICFFGLDAESKIKSDTELVRAIQPSLATTQGKLICISSPYAKRGWAYKQFTKNFGNDEGDNLVVNAPSSVMNSTIPQHIIDQAMADDPASARAEYFAQFRDDITQFIPRETVEAVVVKGRHSLPPETRTVYSAFCDVSGGRSDDAALAIGHVGHDAKVVIDLVRSWPAPHSPETVVGEMCDVIRRYAIDRVIGDNYSAEWAKNAFEVRGIRYDRATSSDWNHNAAAKVTKSRSQLYLELLPRLCSGEIELLDNEKLINQFASLERKTRSGGRDTVDHPPGGHDDLSNAVAGVADAVAHSPKTVGQDLSAPNYQGSDDLQGRWERRVKEFEEEQALERRLMTEADKEDPNGFYNALRNGEVDFGF